MKTWEKVGKVKKDGKKKFMGIISWCIFSTSKIYFEDYFDIYGDFTCSYQGLGVKCYSYNEYLYRKRGRKI